MLWRLVEKVRLLIVLTIILLVVHFFVEGRYLPSVSMSPNLQINDRVAVQKLSDLLRMPIKRGTIIFFYPPPIELGGHDLSYDLPHILGRWTGMPGLPYNPVFIKRVIGLPGEQIRIESGVGVYVNGQLLAEPYVNEAAAYNLKMEADIGGRNSTGAVIAPYADSKRPIVVPEGMLFVLGDNRNASEDSHIWGYLSRDRIVGRLWFLYHPKFEFADAPDWKRSIDRAATDGAAPGNSERSKP
jgi:signal peptidase I